MLHKDTQVITVGLDGSLRGLQRTDGIDLRQFGAADIQRASDVNWCNESQKWLVEIRSTKHGKDKTPTFLLTKALIDAATNNRAITRDRVFYKLIFGSIAKFQERDEAISAEVLVLDYLRLNNIIK